MRTESANSVIHMTTARKHRKLAVALTAAAVLAGGVGVANADVIQGTAVTANQQSGWNGIVRKQVQIDFGKGWVTKAELTVPAGPRPPAAGDHAARQRPQRHEPDAAGQRRLHVRAAGAGASREGYATLRFNKRGVTDVGPVESTDPAQLNPENPYDQIQQDAASVIRFAAAQPNVDASKIYLLGHSEVRTWPPTSRPTRRSTTSRSRPA